MPTVANDRVLYLGPPGILQSPAPQPDYRVLNHYSSAPASMFPLTAYPGGYGQQVAWHSGESQVLYLQYFGTTVNHWLLSDIRPYYALRSQRANQAFRRQPPTSLPQSFTSTGNVALDFFEAVRQVGAAYRATTADVTPALRPDIHPWWADLTPVMGSYDLHATAPSFPIWQEDSVCSGSNYLLNQSGLSARNSFLYDPPLAQDIAPSGAGGGFAVPNSTYLWLDEVQWVTGLPRVVSAFDNWSAAPMQIVDYNAWGVGGSGMGGTGVRSVLLPSTRVAVLNTSTSEVAALRFSVQWPEEQLMWQAPTQDPLECNLQSFLVVVDGIVQ